jgi:NADPH:quinone reductase-like Zn-dependent oxidoreductase
MTLVERGAPRSAVNDVVVLVHASGFVPTELTWPSTWTDRFDRDRTPSSPGRELAGVVTPSAYPTWGLSVGQRVFGLPTVPKRLIGEDHGVSIAAVATILV